MTKKGGTDEEFFRPTHGLALEPYLQLEHLMGIYHIARYQWVKQVLKVLNPSTVLDIACGSGYGAYIIASFLPDARITGADYDVRAIDYAKTHYQGPNLRFLQGDIVSWSAPAPDKRQQLGTYNAIVSFDTLEHIEHREIALLRIVANLTEDGVLVLSTPCAHPETVLTPEWQHHRIEYSHYDLKNLLGRFFREVLVPENNALPYQEYWSEVVNKDKERYLNLANPIVCSGPVK